MRIAVMHAPNLGGSTFIDDFVNNWPRYKTSSNNYRNLIKSENLNLNKNGDEKSQEIILNSLINEIMDYKKEDDVILDRCVLDNLVFSMWIKAKDNNKISDLFLQKTFHLVRQTLIFYDIIFYIPYIKKYNIPMEEKINREPDPNFREELSNFYEVILENYNRQNNNIFPFSEHDMPPIIEIFGTREQRIQIVKLYLNENGRIIGDSILEKELEQITANDNLKDKYI